MAAASSWPPATERSRGSEEGGSGSGGGGGGGGGEDASEEFSVSATGAIVEVAPNRELVHFHCLAATT